MFNKNNLVLFILISIILPLVNYNLELKHLIAFENDSNNFGISDVWGYTDETGIEYAIFGYQYGTIILVSCFIFNIVILVIPFVPVSQLFWVTIP